MEVCVASGHGLTLQYDDCGTKRAGRSQRFWQRLICGRAKLAYDAEGVADRSRGSERSFAPRIEERANTKHPEGMPDRVIQNGFATSRTCPRLHFSREVQFSGIPSGCCYQGDSVPGVSASLQPPATICDRFAIKIVVPNLTISSTGIVTRVACHGPAIPAFESSRTEANLIVRFNEKSPGHRGSFIVPCSQLLVVTTTRRSVQTPC